MTWFFAVLVVLVIGGVAVVAAGHGAPLGPAYDDRPDVRLPAERPVTGADLRELRFDTVVRGYRASEVDALIERLAAQLDGDGPAPRDADAGPDPKRDRKPDQEPGGKRDGEPSARPERP